jgi:heme O synthase-like polyprenyltransferase
MLGAVLLGIIFLIYSANILFEQSNQKIKRLFIFSIIYLPLLMLLIIFDTLFL